MVNFKSQIALIEDYKIKDIKTVGELIDLLKQHKQIYDEDPDYHTSRYNCRSSNDR